MSIKFAILAIARSGSSYLTSALGSHPDVCMHGEIMHENASWHIRECARKQLDLSIRKEDPIKFVNEIYNFDEGKKAVGFKIWKHQSLEAVKYIIENKDIKKIVLERKNLLASFSSRLIAEQTNVWNLTVNQNANIKYDTPKLNFPERRFVKYVEDSLDVYEFYKHGIKSEQQEYLLVDYQENIMNEDIDFVFNYLGIGTKFDFVDKKIKLNKQSNLLDRFVPEDHQKIIQCLENIEKKDWISENRYA